MTFNIKRKGQSTWTPVYDYRLPVGGSFRRVKTAYVAVGGVWKPFFTFVESITTTTTASTSTSTVNNAPYGSVTISGTVSGPSGPVPSGLPVELWDGATKLLSGTTNASGGYSFSWTPDTVGVYNLTVKFPLSTPYQPSQAAVPAITVNTATSFWAVSWNATPTIGQAFVVTGSVVAETGAPTAGTVTLKFGTTSKASGPLAADGSFTVSYTPVTADRGIQSMSLAYGGSGRYLASTMAMGSITVYQPTPAAPSQSVVSLTNLAATIRVSEAANTTKYVSYCVETGSSVTVTSTGVAGTALNFDWNLANDNRYTFRITAYSDNPIKNNTVGNDITVTTGHAAQTDSGSGVFTFSPSKTGSWRSADGWTKLGADLAQGYFSAANGPYTGVARFDYAAMRTAIDTYGTDRSGRWNNATCTKFEAYVTRLSGSGSGSAVPIGWYMTSSDPGVGGQPTLNWGPDTSTPSGLAPGAHAWLTLPDPTNFGAGILAGTWKSVAMYANNSSDYSQYDGASFQIRLTYTWNWTPVPYKAPTWSG